MQTVISRPAPTSVRWANPHIDGIIRRLAERERRSYRAELEQLVIEALIARGMPS